MGKRKPGGLPSSPLVSGSSSGSLASLSLSQSSSGSSQSLPGTPRKPRKPRTVSQSRVLPGEITERQLSTPNMILGHAAFPIFLQSFTVLLIQLSLMFGGFAPSSRLWEVLPYVVLSFLCIEVTRLILARYPTSRIPSFLNLIPFSYICFFSKESHIYVSMVWYFMFALVRRRETLSDTRGSFMRMLVLFYVAYSIDIAILWAFCEPNHPIYLFRLETPIVFREEIVAYTLVFVIHFGVSLLEYNRLLAGEVDEATTSASSSGSRTLTPPSTIQSTSSTAAAASAAAEASSANLTVTVATPKKRNKITSGLPNPSPIIGTAARWEIDMAELEFGDMIGKGASGSVFKGLWNNERVAIKRLVSMSPTSEAELLSQLSHRNIILFRGMVSSPTNPCIVIEYADSGSVYDYLYKSKRPMDGRAVLNWARQIATGMDYLHTGAQRQVIHRDLKSSNILVKGSTLKISDFGLSKEMDKTAQMSTVGTYAWMAPEVIKHEQCSEKVDIWSYAVVLWELITRELPYHGIEPVAIAFHIGQGTLRLPSNLENLPPSLKLLLDACFSWAPKLRPSFKDIIQRLDQAAETNFGQLDAAQLAAQQAVWKPAIREAVGRSSSFSFFSSPAAAAQPVSHNRPARPPTSSSSLSTSSSASSSSTLTTLAASPAASSSGSSGSIKMNGHVASNGASPKSKQSPGRPPAVSAVSAFGGRVPKSPEVKAAKQPQGKAAGGQKGNAWMKPPSFG